MEILQTIWTTLTTENEDMMNIICSPLTFLEAYITMLLFTSIIKIETTKMKNILYITIFSTIANITNIVVPMPYFTIVNTLAAPILVMIIYRTNVFKAILSEIIPYIFFISISLLLQIYCTKVLHLTLNEILYVPLYKVLTSLLIYIFILMIYFIFLSKKFKITYFVNNRLLIFNFILGLIAIIVENLILIKYMSVLSVSSILGSLTILFIYFSINMYSLSRTSNLETTTEKLEAEQLYNKTLTILYDNIRGFKHDFNNIVQSIEGYISTNNMKGLKEYHNDLMNDCQKLNSLAILNPELINNPAIYSILTSKYYKAEELGIKMNIEVFLDMQNLNIKLYELTRILGVLLDNAIEASSECDNKKLNIIIRKDEKANRQLFIIENTYSNKDVNIDRIFEKGYTSKKSENDKSHGLGLWNVKQIIKKNNNLNLFTTKDNTLFKQQLEIYY